MRNYDYNFEFIPSCLYPTMLAKVATTGQRVRAPELNTEDYTFAVVLSSCHRDCK